MLPRYARRAVLTCLTAMLANAPAGAHEGYYRHPWVHEDTIVFCAEGDLWVVPIEGGAARRLTTHPGEETTPSISPDGRTVAYVAEYEGPDEVYTIPVAGGVPVRRTYGADRPAVVGWTPDGHVLYHTREFSTLPDRQLVTIDVETRSSWCRR